MPREDTQFRPGESGNPRGRPKGRTSMRDAVRRALLKPDATGERSLMEAWAERLIANAVEPADMLNVLKWLEGGAPTQDALALQELAANLDEIGARLDARRDDPREEDDHARTG